MVPQLQDEIEAGWSEPGWKRSFDRQLAGRAIFNDAVSNST
jgi:hypothetical protein